MFFPTIIDPRAFKVQTASQQKPFFFGGSPVPEALATSRPTRSQIRLKKLVKRR